MRLLCIDGVFGRAPIHVMSLVKGRSAQRELDDAPSFRE